MRFPRVLRFFNNKACHGQIFCRETSSVHCESSSGDTKQGVQDVPVASSSVKRCLHQSCGYTSGWCTIFSFLGGGFCGLGTAHNGMGDAECEVWTRHPSPNLSGIDALEHAATALGDHESKSTSEKKTIKLLQKVPENTRWDVFLGSLLTQNTHSAFAALLSVFERGRVKVLIDKPRESESEEVEIAVVRDESSEEYDCSILGPEASTTISEEEIESNLETVPSSVPSQTLPQSLTNCSDEREDSVMTTDSHGPLDMEEATDGSERLAQVNIYAKSSSVTQPGLNSNNFLLQSPFESLGMNLPHPLSKTNKPPQYSQSIHDWTASDLFHSECSSVHAASSAFESPSEQHTTLPQLIYNIEVRMVEGSWEKGGGYSIVRKGLHADCLGREYLVAVKHVRGSRESLAEKSKEALKNEWEVLSRLPTHPNVVRMIGVNFNASIVDDHCMLLAEELMESDLSDVLHGSRSERGLTYGQIVGICMDIARGLEHIHKNNVVHFDLKPQNILLDENLTAKIADFGSSKYKTDKEIGESVGAGTLGYVAPEISTVFAHMFRVGSSAPDGKVDVYSLGVILYECITGRSLFECSRSSSSELHFRDGSGSVGFLNPYENGLFVGNWCPEVLRNIVYNSTHFDCMRRASASEILRQFEKIDQSAPWLNEKPQTSIRGLEINKSLCLFSKS